MANFSLHFSEDRMPEFIYRPVLHKFLFKLKILFECAIIARALRVFLYLSWNSQTLIFQNI